MDIEYLEEYLVTLKGRVPRSTDDGAATEIANKIIDALSEAIYIQKGNKTGKDRQELKGMTRAIDLAVSTAIDLQEGKEVKVERYNIRKMIRVIENYVLSIVEAYREMEIRDILEDRGETIKRARMLLDAREPLAHLLWGGDLHGRAYISMPV